MTRVFPDYGFESGQTAPWTATTIYPVTSPATTTVTSDYSPPNSGNVAAKITILPTSAWAGANLKYTLSAAALELWLRQYVNISELTPTTITNGNSVQFQVAYSGTTSQIIASARIINNGGTLFWRLMTRNKNTGYPYVDVPLTQSGWVCVELHAISGTLGSAELYINGSRVAQITGVDNANCGTGNIASPMNILIFGSDRSATTALPATQTITVGVDDCAADNGTVPIGPITPPSNPKITVNSNPELNVPIYVDGVLMGNTPLVVSVPSGTHTVRVDTEVTR